MRSRHHTVNEENSTMVKIDDKNLHDADEEFNNTLRDMYEHAMCLCEYCNKRACRSHIIPRSILKLLEENGNINIWRKKSSEQLVRIRHKYTHIKQLPETDEPVYVSIGAEGIHDTVTYPLFCQDHDKDLFKPIENGNPIALNPSNMEQVFFLQYRIAASLVFDTKRGQLELDELHSIAQRRNLHEIDPNRIANIQPDINNNGAYKTFNQCERIRITKQYDRLDCQIYLIDVPHSIAAAQQFIPPDNNDSHQRVSLKDYMFFTLLPHVGVNKSVCILSWLKGSKRAEQFIHFYKLNTAHDLTDDEREKLLLEITFQSSTLYISPRWWKNTLSDQEREYYKQIRKNLYREGLFRLFGR